MPVGSKASRVKAHKFPNSAMVARRPAAAGHGKSSATKGVQRVVKSTQSDAIFVCAAGSGGGRSRQALLHRFGTVKEVHFSSAPNLTSEEREAPHLLEIVKAAKAAAKPKRPIFLVGHSFGARAAVHLLARDDFCRQLPSNVKGIIAFGYPLVHPTQHREKKLLELPPGTRVLFISGTRDPFMGDFKLMENTLKKSKLRHTLVKVEGGDHGLKCPKSQEDLAVSNIQEAIKAFIKSGPR